jgi:hypothetical protein
MNHAPAQVETFVREGDIHFITEHFANPEEDIEYAEKIMDFLNRKCLSLRSKN